MDEIRIDGLRFFGHHGVYPFETEQGQNFVLSAVLRCDTRRAGCSDALEDSTSYADVAQFLVEFLTDHTYRLLEAAVEQAARAVLLRFPLVREVELELQKPEAPIPLDFRTVSVCICRRWHTAYVALGSNLGHRLSYLTQALAGMNADENIRLSRVSTLLETAPYGGVAQDDFLNGVCRVETLYTPQELLEALHALEHSAQRVRVIHWGPRTLDLDLLLYDDLVQDDPALTIPHPDMQNRDFVLKPMAEIAPYAEHPVLHRSMRELWGRLEGTWN